MIGQVKFKIDNCSKTYENFSLLYLKAKIFLVKRLIDSKSDAKQYTKNPSLPSQQMSSQSHTQNVASTTATTPPSSNKKKSSKMDKFLSIFFKPLIELSDNTSRKGSQDEDSNHNGDELNEVTNLATLSAASASNEQMFGFQENQASQLYGNVLLTPQVEIDLNDIKTK